MAKRLKNNRKKLKNSKKKLKKALDLILEDR